MAIELIAKIKQKNNGTFPLMDAADVDWSSDVCSSDLLASSTPRSPPFRSR